MSDVTKFNIGGTDYTVRDINTLRSLNSAQATQLTTDGTYNGEDVVNGEVFTNETGKFQEFTKEVTGATGTAVGITSPTSDKGRSIAYDHNSTLVYVENTTGEYGYSTDNGATWTAGTLPTVTTKAWRTVTWGDGVFVAFGTGAIAYSSDGVTWNLGTGISSNTTLFNGCYDTYYGMFVGVGTGKIVTSSDGINWTEKTLSSDSGKIFARVASNSTGTIVVLSEQGVGYYTTDGTNWTRRTNSISTKLSTLVWDGIAFTGLEVNNSKTIYSEDGITWTEETNDLPADSSIITLTYGGGFYLVESYASSTTSVHISADTVHWFSVTTDPATWSGCSAVYNDSNDKFYVCGENIQVITPAEGWTYSLTDKSVTKADIDGANYLTNASTASHALTLLGTATTQANAVNIGYNSQASSGGYSVAIGSSAITRGNGVSVGKEAQQSSGCSFGVALGSESKIGAFVCGSALGAKASVQAHGSIQIGQGTNSEAQTLYVGFSDSSGTATNNYKMLDSSGKIPAARLTNAVQGALTSSSVTLAAADWSANAQTVTVNGITSSSFIWVSPATASASAYADAGILCTAQATDSLTFTCDNTPSTDITVTIVFG